MEHCSNRKVRYRKGRLGLSTLTTTQHRFGLARALGIQCHSTLGTWEVVLADVMVDSSCNYTLDASQMPDFQGDTPSRRMLNKVRQQRIRQGNSEKLE